MRHRTVPALLLSVLLVACATGDTNPYAENTTGSGGQISSCKSGDTPIAAANQCLQDDAACYQLSGGGWCTGERGTTCPTGSTQLTQGEQCPPGTRCFVISDSMTCAISFK